MEENGPLPDILQAVNVTIIDRRRCNSDDWLVNMVTINMFCAGEPDGKRDACQVKIILLWCWVSNSKTNLYYTLTVMLNCVANW